MTKPLYVFDMDETLIDADCVMLWHQFLVEKGIATDPNFLKTDKELMAIYAKGELDMQQYLDFSIAPLFKLKTQQVSELAAQCVEEKVLPTFFPQAKALIASLHQQQIPVLIVSASVSFLIKEIAKKMGVQHSIGVDLVENNHCYTAEISGVPSYQEGKVTRLKQWINEQNQAFSEIHFYTDSINDLPLCEYADFAHLVNPCPLLKEKAQGRSWEILDWYR